MKKSTYIYLYLISLVVCCTAAWFETVPGYMDAEYYYSGALRLVEGHGWSEMFIWNYLDNPTGLPHPAFVYWMPLASLIAIPGMVMFNNTHFLTARLFMIILAAFISPITTGLSYRMFKRLDYALLSGGLALFPGFYLIYTTNIETFTPFFILGGLFFLIGFNQEDRISNWEAASLGVISGFMHLARSDGVLWLIGAFFLLVWRDFKGVRQKKFDFKPLICRILLIFVAYSTIMVSWYGRNLVELGSIFPGGTSRALWLTSYNQLFSYPSNTINISTWVQSGWINILNIRWLAAVSNLKTTLGVQGLVFLLPLFILGAITNKDKELVKFGLGMWMVTFLVMTVVFPFAGSRGGFFHSSSASQIFLWTLVPSGLDVSIRWLGRKMKWNIQQARKVFSFGIVLVSAIVTGYLYWQFVPGFVPNQILWSQGTEQAIEIETWLVDHQISKAEPVFINNPPGFYSANRRPAYVVPDGNPDVTLAAARFYKVKYLVLEKSHVEGLNELYNSPDKQPGFSYLGSIKETRIFEIKP